MKKILLSLMLAAVSAQAQFTVSATGGVGERDVRTQTGDAATGARVSIGVLSTDVSTPEDLLSGWSEFGTTKVRDIFGTPGKFAASWTQSDGAEFENSKLWLLITYGGEQGLYTSGSANWTLPSADANPLARTVLITASQIDYAAWGSFDANSLHLQAVPEPSSILLGAVLGLAFAAVLKIFSRSV